MPTQHQQLSELVSQYLIITKQIEDERPDSYEEIHTSASNPNLRKLHKQRHQVKQKIIEYIKANGIENLLLSCGNKVIEIQQYGESDPNPHFKIMDAIVL